MLKGVRLYGSAFSLFVRTESCNRRLLPHVTIKEMHSLELCFYGGLIGHEVDYNTERLENSNARLDFQQR
jgi:hypothetical protein